LTWKATPPSPISTPFDGTSEKVVQDIAEGLKDRVSMEVLACQPKGTGESKVINGVRVTQASSFGIYFGMPVSMTFPFILARKSREADILHFHEPFPLGGLSYLLMGSKQKKSW
jgi:rhamnosyl/mannosyltransferase